MTNSQFNILPSGNLIGETSLTIEGLPIARQQIVTYYNGLMNTTSEHLKARDYKNHPKLVAEIERCRIYLEVNK